MKYCGPAILLSVQTETSQSTHKTWNRETATERKTDVNYGSLWDNEIALCTGVNPPSDNSRGLVPASPAGTTE